MLRYSIMLRHSFVMLRYSMEPRIEKPQFTHVSLKLGLIG